MVQASRVDKSSGQVDQAGEGKDGQSSSMSLIGSFVNIQQFWYRCHHQTFFPPCNDSPSCVDSKTVQNDTVGNAPPVGGVKGCDDDDDNNGCGVNDKRFVHLRYKDDDDNDADDLGFKPEERSASRKLCGILGDVSRHQRHHLGSAL